MRNYLLLLALAWMPFAHVCGLSTPKATSEEKETPQKESIYFWHFSGKGEVIINFISPTEKSSTKVFFKKDGEIKEVTDKEEISRWITFKKSAIKESKFTYITLKKDAPHKILVIMNMHAHNHTNIRLHNQVRIKIAKTEEMLGHILGLTCWDDSHLFLPKISTDYVFISMWGNSKLSANELKVIDYLELYGTDNSNIHIKNIAGRSLDVIGKKNSKISLKGKASRGDIRLTDSSILTAPQLHIKKGKLKMQDSAHAHLSIEDIEEQEIKDEAQFENEENSNSFKRSPSNKENSNSFKRLPFLSIEELEKQKH